MKFKIGDRVKHTHTGSTGTIADIRCNYEGTDIIKLTLDPPGVIGFGESDCYELIPVGTEPLSSPLTLTAEQLKLVEKYSDMLENLIGKEVNMEVNDEVHH